jgi:hypothetical protein
MQKGGFSRAAANQESRIKYRESRICSADLMRQPPRSSHEVKSNIAYQSLYSKPKVFGLRAILDTDFVCKTHCVLTSSLSVEPKARPVGEGGG